MYFEEYFFLFKYFDVKRKAKSYFYTFTSIFSLSSVFINVLCLTRAVRIIMAIIPKFDLCVVKKKYYFNYFNVYIKLNLNS